MADEIETHAAPGVSLLLVGVFLTTLGVSLLTFAVPLLSLDARAGGLWIGSAFAGFFLARLVTSPLAGVWADRAGIRVPLAVSSCAGAVAPLVYFLWPALNTLYFIQFVLGLVIGVLRPVYLTGLGQGRGAARRFGWAGSVMNLGFLFGPLLGGWLYLERAVEPLLLVLSLCMGLTFVSTLSLKSVPAGVVRHTSSESREGRWPLYLAILGRTLGVGALVAFYPLLLAGAVSRNGLVVAGLFTVPMLLSTLLAPVFGRIMAGRSMGAWTVAGLAVSAVGLYSLGLVSSWPGFVAAGMVMGLGTALSLPASMALVAGGAGRGTGFGLAQTWTGLGLLLGPLAAGLMVGWGMDLGRVFQLVALAGAAGCLPLAVRIQRRDFHLGAPVAVFLALLVLGAGAAHFSLQSGGVLEPDAEGVQVYSGVAMGTVVNLTLEGETRVTERAAQAAMEAMRTLAARYDHRNPSGDVGRVNQEAGKGPVAVARSTMVLLEHARELARNSGGAFDPTVGALTTNPLYYMLDDVVRDHTKGLVDYRLLRLDPYAGTAFLSRKGMALDLGGIAKGAVIDAAVGVLRKHGVAAGMVEAGGDFYCFGPRAWTVGVRDPREEGVIGTVAVKERGVCGSGDYQQFTMIQEGDRTERSHHILDTRTLRSAAGAEGVTVVAESAEMADGLATTLMVLGPDKGAALLAEHYPDAGAAWVLEGGRVVATPGFFEER